MPLRSADASGYETQLRDQPPWVRLSYTVTPWGGEPVDYDYKILLASTTPNYGGQRWWFVCPLTKGGRDCFRRVGKLYLPPGGRHYGCRQCYDLSYESAHSHKQKPQPKPGHRAIRS